MKRRMSKICVLQFMKVVPLISTVNERLEWDSVRWSTDDEVYDSLKRDNGISEETGIAVRD